MCCMSRAAPGGGRGNTNDEKGWATSCPKTPRFTNDAVGFDGPRKMQHAGLETKQALAAVNGAAALILVNDASELAKKGDPLISYAELSGASAMAFFTTVCTAPWAASLRLGIRWSPAARPASPANR